MPFPLCRFNIAPPWLDPSTEVEHIAVFYDYPKGRDIIAGGQLISIDELVAEIRKEVTKCGPMISNAIPQQFPLLLTIQMSHFGYSRALH